MKAILAHPVLSAIIALLVIVFLYLLFKPKAPATNTNTAKPPASNGTSAPPAANTTQVTATGATTTPVVPPATSSNDTVFDYLANNFSNGLSASIDRLGQITP